MKRKKYLLTLIILGVCFIIGNLVVSAHSQKSKVKANEPVATRQITDNIFQQVKIQETASPSRVLEQEDYLLNDSEVKVTLSFKFENKNYRVGDTFETTLPEGFTYTTNFEGNLSDTATFVIDARTRKLLITIIKDVQSADYKIELTTRIRFAEDLNSKQTMAFPTQTPTNYLLHLYKDGYNTVQSKMLDQDGNSSFLMPAKQTFSGNANPSHVDISRNSLYLNSSKEVKPTYFEDGYVTVITDANSYLYETYETAIDGTQIGERRELKVNEDFTIIGDPTGTCQIRFKEKFYEALQISGEKKYDYSSFNPVSNGQSNNISPFSSFRIYKGTNDTSQMLSNSSFIGESLYVFTVGYLGFGRIQGDNNVTDEAIVNTPIYINSTNQSLKKGDTFTLTNVGVEKEVVYIDTPLIREYSIAFDLYGRLTIGTKGVVKNWEITTNKTGEITLTYLGEDTTQAFGLDLYIGRDESLNVDKAPPNFQLSGNGYQTTGKPNFPRQTATVKSGTVNETTLQIEWKAMMNPIYQKITVIKDTFTSGIKNGTLQDFKIVSAEFGQNGTKKTLKENEDYTLVDAGDSFEVKFLTTTNKKVYITYTTGIDIATLVSGRAVNTMKSKSTFNSLEEKELTTIGYAYIPNYFITNSPFLLGKNDSSSMAEIINSKPVNRVKVVINPMSSKLTNNEVVINYKALDVATVGDVFSVNKVKQFSSSSYSGLTLGEEVFSDSEEYPKILIEDNQIRISNKNLTQAIVISFTLGKNNNYSINSEYATLSQTNDEYTPVNSKTYLYFNNTLGEKWLVQTSAEHSNIAEAKLTVPAKNGSPLIVGTEMKLDITPNTEGREVPSLREVRDGEGNLLDSSVITVSKPSYGYWTIKINNGNLTKGLSVKMSLLFETSGVKRYSSAGSQHSYINSSGNVYSQSYNPTYSSGTFAIDNSGAGGSGNLILTDLTLTIFDEKTNSPLAGASYELKLEDGRLIETPVSNVNGQIIVKDLPVATYRIIEVNKPEGYLTNGEYSSPGREITLKSDGTNSVKIPYVREGKIIVNFSYPDGTLIENTTPIVITGGSGTRINLQTQTDVAAQLRELESVSSDYQFLNFDQGTVAGRETDLEIPQEETDVYYRYEGLLSLKVPDLLSFETGFVSPFEQTLSYNNTENFEVAVRDSRQMTTSAVTSDSKIRGNIRLNASLSKEFTTTSNKVLKDARLIYQSGSESVVLNGTGGEIVKNKQNTENPANKEFKFVLDTVGSGTNGFKLEVPAKGTLAEEYTGEVTWEIIQEP